jgi:hypothetical protein
MSKTFVPLCSTTRPLPLKTPLSEDNVIDEDNGMIFPISAPVSGSSSIN